jgi:hypothetical protein
VEAKLIDGYPGKDEHDALCDYPDELIDRLAQIMKDEYRLWEELSRYVITVSARNSYRDMNELLYFMTPFRERLNIRYLSGTILPALRSNTCLPPMDDYSSAPDHVRDQCAALLLVSITIDVGFVGDERSTRTNPFGAIKDPRLADLLMAHPERAEEIAAAIEERQTTDFDLLNDIASSAIGEGML